MWLGCFVLLIEGIYTIHKLLYLIHPGRDEVRLQLPVLLCLELGDDLEIAHLDI